MIPNLAELAILCLHLVVDIRNDVDHGKAVIFSQCEIISTRTLSPKNYCKYTALQLLISF
jgi:hypothetical protein